MCISVGNWANDRKNNFYRIGNIMFICVEKLEEKESVQREKRQGTTYYLCNMKKNEKLQ